MRVLVLASLGIFAVGCAEKEAADPGEVVRADNRHFQRGPAAFAGGRERLVVTEGAAPSRDGARTVRCGASDDGLHITAPPGSRVTVPDDATLDPEAQIVLPYDAEGRPIRQTKSLGFIGDNPLTQTPSRGGPWNVPDALLPAHTHREPYYGPRGGGYGSGRLVGGYAPVAPYAASSYTPTTSTPARTGAPGGGFAAAAVGPSGMSPAAPRMNYR